MGTIQGDVSHAVHRVRSVPAAVADGYVADDAVHDLRRHLLRTVPRSRDQPHPVP